MSATRPLFRRLLRPLALLVLAAAVGWIGWQVVERIGGQADKKKRSTEERPAPVITAPIERAPIALERTFSGTLEAYAEFVAAPKVSGIVERLTVNLGDRVRRGQVVAQLDNAEFEQAVAQAEAELEVSKANLAEAASLLAIAERELRRVDQLSERGVSSASQQDAAQADQLAKQAHLQVTRAELARAESQVKMAQIKLGYSRVIADWHDDDDERLVAERFVDEGENVAANAPLLKIVKLDPVVAVIHVTEKDYADLHSGQPVSLVTDAYPGRRFAGTISRIAPVFREASRQARIEVVVANPDLALKPGMFVRATVILKQLAEATLVPAQALTRRDDRDGLFVLGPDRQHVAWRPVQPGIQQGDRLQVSGEGLEGEAVVLGQQLLKDGSAVILPEAKQPR